jgi:multidrug efflux pump subunit AcrB
MARVWSIAFAATRSFQPLTLNGGSLWAPMGWTIIGGLLSSTVLALLVTPILYQLFTR